MAFSSYKYGFGGTTTIRGLQSMAALSAPVVSARRRVALSQTTFALRFGQIQPSQVEESGGIIDLLNDNLRVGTLPVTAPDGTSETVRFGNAQDNVMSATVADVAVTLVKVR